MATGGDGDSPSPARQEYIEGHWRQADLIHRIAERRDTIIFAGAAGGIGISITFLDRIASNPFSGSIWMLFASWAAFLLALGSALFSLYSTEKAHRKMLENYHAEYRGVETDMAAVGQLNWWTRLLNNVAIGGVVIGAILLTLFAALNLTQDRSAQNASARAGRAVASAHPGTRPSQIRSREERGRGNGTPSISSPARAK